MDESTKKTLCQQLKSMDTAIVFLVFTILGILLSFWSTQIQREQLVCTIEGDTEAAQAAPPVYPIRHAASALFVGATGYFLCLALRNAKQAEAGDDRAAKKSASTNVWASLFVLAAAVLRLQDLDFMECARQTSLAQSDVIPGT